MPGIPVDGVITEPVKEIAGVPELGLGLTIALVIAPVDEVLPWPLNVTAPVSIEVSKGSDDEPPPVVRVARMLGTELVDPIDELVLETPGDKGVGIVSVLVNEPESVGCGMVILPLKVDMTSETEVLFDIPDDIEPVLIVDKGCEAEPGPVIVPSLVMLTDGGEVALVKFVTGYGPEVRVWLGVTDVPVPDPELVPEVGPLDAGSKLVFVDT